MELSSEKNGMSEVAELFEENDSFYLYKNNKIFLNSADAVSRPEYGIIELNKAVRYDYEIRYCIDYTGNSELMSIVLSNQEWSDLESEYGDKCLSARFMKLPESIENFPDTIGDLEVLKGDKL